MKKILNNLLGIEQEIETLQKAKFQVELYKTYRDLENITAGYNDIFDVIFNDIQAISNELDTLSEKKTVTAKNVKQLREIKKDIQHRQNVINEQLNNI